MSKEGWKDESYKAVEEAGDMERHNRMIAQPSTHLYQYTKDWGRVPESHAFPSGEVDRLGVRVPERYLDDRVDLRGTRLKILCRSNSLPIMRRVGKEIKPPWAVEQRVCLMCKTGVVKDMEHFIMDCASYEVHRARMYEWVERKTDRASTSIPPGGLRSLDKQEQLLIILGKRFGKLEYEDRVNKHVKRFLRKCWNARSQVTATINEMCGTSYEVGFVLDSQD
jgi:hypothetical protein